MKLSLIIPCYNESANIPLLLERCHKLKMNPDIEVILVDNGSTDNTADVLSQLLPSYTNCRSIPVNVNQGYGFGILSGLKAAKGEIIGWTHADMQTDPIDVLKGIELFEQYGSNIFVKGRRYGRPLIDVLFTIGMSFFETLLLRKPLWDINAQPTLFSKDFFDTWKNPPHDFSLDLYAYYLALSQKLKIYRFPVLFAERAYGVSHWNVNWIAKWKFIKRTVSFSLNLRKAVCK
jgi:glycosyltransferase involved in cell wall biosynthesis